jgi:hypothetical protein
LDGRQRFDGDGGSHSGHQQREWLGLVRLRYGALPTQLGIDPTDNLKPSRIVEQDSGMIIDLEPLKQHRTTEGHSDKGSHVQSAQLGGRGELKKPDEQMAEPASGGGVSRLRGVLM